MAVTLTAANAARWEKAKLTRAAEFTPVAKRLVAAKARYMPIQDSTGVPWFVIAVIHQRESAQRWDRSIAQGDPWNRKSTHVPKGRGPFGSFEEAAVDALMNCAPFAGKWKDWSAGGTMTLLEHYNGLGYYRKGKPSPYIWSGTDQYSRGKYVADGVYDANAVDKQLGCAGLILAIQKLDRSVKFSDDVEPLALVSDDVASDSQAVPAVVDDDEFQNIQPVTVAPRFNVEMIQKRLDSIGYHEVGGIDGVWGGKTAAAIAAFKNDRGIPGEPAIDKVLTDALDDLPSGWTRPIAPERANVTAKDIAPKVESVRQTLWQRFWAKITGFGALIAAAFKGASDYFDGLKDQVRPVMDFFTDIPGWLWLVGIGGAALLLYLSANKATNSIVDDKRSGRLN